MKKASCQVCEKGKAEGVKLSFCSSCRSVSYCSRACQKADWKAHKVICKQLNVGDAKQIVHADHQSNAETVEALSKGFLSECGQRVRRFFDLFFESKGDTDHTDTVRKMKEILLKESRYNREEILFRSLSILSQLPFEMLKLPTSPLKVALQFVDMSCPGLNMVDDGRGATPLHWLTETSDPSKEHTLENQCIIARQLIEAGANVNARAQRCLYKITPLHNACSSMNCTNLGLIQLLLDHGANPNAKDSDGETPLRYTMMAAPGVAKFLLTYSDKTNPDILTNDGRSFLAIVRSGIARFTNKATPDPHPEKGNLLFLVKQWQEIAGRTWGFRLWVAGINLIGKYFNNYTVDS
jgi:hypothetical protein